ncbi:hypothetical protein TSUD_227080 [Trifolium subterraneum]|uniref:Reverse transcriptase domain-containing protein n=1 Tax=Trifolium subterraneum TaxID=3900 RepID=A0A2Z6NI24_TRISU|nr:hypothetical protein TSUD_227080 [Trifolium subterraneum]
MLSSFADSPKSTHPDPPQSLPPWHMARTPCVYVLPVTVTGAMATIDVGNHHPVAMLSSFADSPKSTHPDPPQSLPPWHMARTPCVYVLPVTVTGAMATIDVGNHHFVQHLQEDWANSLNNNNNNEVNKGGCNSGKQASSTAKKDQISHKHSKGSVASAPASGHSNRKLKKKILVPPAYGIRKMARLSETERHRLIQSLKKAKNKQVSRCSSKANAHGDNCTSFSVGPNNSKNTINSQDWNNWFILHGNEKQIQEDINEVGEKLGVKCDNRFQALVKGKGGALEKRREIRKLVLEKRVDILCIQESKMEVVDDSLILSLWGPGEVNFSFVPSVGASGGIITLWNPCVVNVWSSIRVENCLIINGNYIQSQTNFFLANIYASCDEQRRVCLWNALKMMVQRHHLIAWCVVGDFNAIRNAEERCSLVRTPSYSSVDCSSFNLFIDGSNLIDLPLFGRKFTWYRDDGSCMSRGLRQGDPLSPFLYLLAAEGLHVMMDAAVSNHLYSPYSIGNHNEVNVSHLQFADDTLLVGTKSWANIRILKAVLSLFENVSGLKINFHKSMLFGVNVNDSWLHEAASVLRCKHGRLPFLYLGLPIGGDARKLQFWYPLVDKIRNRLSGWKCKHLSMGGRLILLKSVLSSMPVYFLSFFKAPAGIISSLNSIFCQFLWGGSEENQKMVWIKWDSVCLNKKNGGLGVRRLREFNFSLLGKWIWRILEEKDSLWKQVLQAKYDQEGGRIRFVEGVGSCWWRSLNHIRTGVGLLDPRWLVDNIVRKVGDGRNTLFWKDNWLDDGPVERSFSRLYALAENKLVTVADMCDLGWGPNGEGWRWRRGLRAWEEDLVKECITRLSNVFMQVTEQDKWVWKLHPSSCYNVKSAYSYLTESDVHLNEDYNRFMRVKSLPLKVNLFMWRLFLNKLPTKDNLLRRGILDGSAFQGTLSSHSTQFCGMGGLSKSCHILLTTIWAATLFIIWKDRNSRVFKAKHATIEALVEHIKLQSYWWLKANYVLFDFDYSFWRNNPFHCRQAFV